LHDEPASQALLTLAAPERIRIGNVRPSKFDVAYALKLALDMDLVRAQLLTEIVIAARILRFPRSTRSIPINRSASPLHSETDIRPFEIGS